MRFLPLPLRRPKPNPANPYQAALTERERLQLSQTLSSLKKSSDHRLKRFSSMLPKRPEAGESVGPIKLPENLGEVPAHRWAMARLTHYWRKLRLSLLKASSWTLRPLTRRCVKKCAAWLSTF